MPVLPQIGQRLRTARETKVRKRGHPFGGKFRRDGSPIAPPWQIVLQSFDQGSRTLVTSFG
jgi:hypothetical protein